MSLGFDGDIFLISNIKPFLQDPGISKRLIFSSITRSISSDGSQEKTEIQSEATGIVASNPEISNSELQQVFPDGKISKEVVRIFFIESDLIFTIKNGYTLLIYESDILLGEYQIKYISRNMVIPDVVMALCVSGR